MIGHEGGPGMAENCLTDALTAFATAWVILESQMIEIKLVVGQNNKQFAVYFI